MIHLHHHVWFSDICWTTSCLNDTCWTTSCLNDTSFTTSWLSDASITTSCLNDERPNVEIVQQPFLRYRHWTTPKRRLNVDISFFSPFLRQRSVSSIPPYHRLDLFLPGTIFTTQFTLTYHRDHDFVARQLTIRENLIIDRSWYQD